MNGSTLSLSQAMPNQNSTISQPKFTSGFNTMTMTTTDSNLAGLSLPAIVPNLNVPSALGPSTNREKIGNVVLTQKDDIILGPASKRLKKDVEQTKLNLKQEEAIEKVKKYAMEQSIRQVLVKHTIAQQQAQMIHFQTSVQRQQALALMCRVYVGSLSFEIDQKVVENAFSPFGPIADLSLPYDNITQHHKGFAFVEYRVPDAASLALVQMDGVKLGGRFIKVGRPSNMPQAQPIIEKLAEEAKAHNRVYVADIHSDLNETDIQSVFGAFGKIRSCVLPLDPSKPGKHQGYAYIEYEERKGCEDAVNSMNMFDLGGQLLRVGRCVTPADITVSAPVSMPSSMPTAAAVAAAAVSMKLSALETMENGLFYTNSNCSQNSPKVSSINNGPPAPGVFIPTGLGGASTEDTFKNSTTPDNIVVPPVGIAIPSGLGGTPAVTSVSLSNSPISIPVNSIQSPIFIENEKPAITITSNTNGMSQKLKNVEPDIDPATIAAAEEDEKPDNEAQLSTQESLNISGPSARQMIMHKLMQSSAARNQSTECRVLILRNMVEPSDIDDDLESEITEECGKFGNVQRVIIYQENQSEELDAEAIVKIFVEFTNEKEVEASITALHNRFFAGKTVIAEKYNQYMYDMQDLSG